MGLIFSEEEISIAIIKIYGVPIKSGGAAAP